MIEYLTSHGYSHLMTEWYWSFMQFVAIMITFTLGLGFTFYQYKADLEQRRVADNSLMNIDLDEKLRNAVKRIASHDGEINDIMDRDFKEIKNDMIREDIFDILNILHKACYYYRKTNRNIMNSHDFWRTTLHYYASKPVIITAFKKHEKYNYHPDLVRVLQHHYFIYKSAHPCKPKIDDTLAVEPKEDKSIKARNFINRFPPRPLIVATAQMKHEPEEA